MNRRRNKKMAPFVALDRNMLWKSEEWRVELTSNAKVLYLYLKSKFRGSNNGDISLHYRELKGVMAFGTLAKALRRLEQQGWIERTKRGGLYRYENRFRLTGRFDPAIINYEC